MNIFLLLLYFNFIYSALNEKQKEKYLEELKVVFKKLNIVPNDKQQIDQKSMARVIKYVFGGLDKSGNNLPSSAVEDEFTYIIIKNLLQGQPELIDVKNIPDILDPKKLEDMTNDMLKNFKMDRVEQKIKQELEKQKAKKKKNSSNKDNNTPNTKQNISSDSAKAKNTVPEDKIEL